MSKGKIYKALSGFYYVKPESGGELFRCRARGKFRKDNLTPLVGDNVEYTDDGVLTEIYERRNEFIRPSVANIDVLVIFASEAIPVTDPFLIDRVAAIARVRSCDSIVCINKTDLKSGDGLYEIYKKAGIPVIKTSAVTGEGIEELKAAITGKTCAFTGNSGVGKSSILNAIEPKFALSTGEVSEKLGRGRHTTRHVELFDLSCGAVIADTPGFSAFDTEQMELTKTSDVLHAFAEFDKYEGDCRFLDCAHISEPGCAVLKALKDGEICPTRHESYVRLYEQAKQYKEWENK